MSVMLHHAVRIDPKPGLALRNSGLSRVQMCMRLGLNQTKKGLLSRFARSMNSSEAARNSSSTVSIRFLVSGPVSSHFCLPPWAKARIVARRDGRGRDAFQDAARTEHRLEGGVLRVIRVLRFILGVQVIEVAEKLVEAVHRRQKLVAIAEMVLAELPGRIALRLEQVGNGRVFLRQAFFRGRQPDFQQAGAQRRLAGDEGRASRGTDSLPVVVGEDRALIGDAVDIRRVGSPSCRGCRR